MTDTTTRPAVDMVNLALRRMGVTSFSATVEAIPTRAFKTSIAVAAPAIDVADVMAALEMVVRLDDRTGGLALTVDRDYSVVTMGSSLATVTVRY